MGKNFSDLYGNSLPDNFFDYAELSPLNVDLPESTGSVILDDLKPREYSVAFDSKCKSYCIGCVDMVNSTKISAQLGTGKISRYYQIFLNSMSKIIGEYGGTVIKNIGDCLMYYFPSSGRYNNTFGFMSCIECNLCLVEAHDFICEQLRQEGLPNLDYRISSDYGSVCIMQSTDSFSLDMIGPPVNMCSKINRLAKPNQVVVGGDFHQMAKSLKEYNFKSASAYSLGFKFSYPVYTVSRKNSEN